VTVIYGIDAGSTHTRICVEAPGVPVFRWQVGSINPAAVGAATAVDRLHETFRVVADAAAGRPSLGWLASASIVADTAPEELAVMRALLPPGSTLLAVSNDAVPMLFAPPLADCGAVVLAGTGSAFIGCDGTTVVQLGSYEYLGSDQGSGFDIGLHGLRAALRARDGIGPPSALPESLSRHVGRDLASEARHLAAVPFPKQAVARLAPVVIQCWLGGDVVAGGVVTAAVESLAAGVAQVRRQLQLAAASGTVLAGGLVTGCAEFASFLRAAIERACGRHPLTVCTDPAATVLSCARRLAETGKGRAIGRAYLDRHVWLARPAGVGHESGDIVGYEASQ